MRSGDARAVDAVLREVRRREAAADDDAAGAEAAAQRVEGGALELGALRALADAGDADAALAALRSMEWAARPRGE